MIIVIFIIYVLISTSIVYINAKGRRGLDSVIVFALAAFIYYMAIPMEIYITNVDYLRTVRGYIYISNRENAMISIMAVLALIGFSAGMWWSGFTHRFDVKNESGAIGDQRLGLLLLFLLSFIIIALRYGDLVSQVSVYAGNYTVLNTKPIFAYLTKIFVVSSSVLACYLIRKDGVSLAPLFLISLCILWGVYSSNKDPILIGMLGLFAIVYRTRILRRPVLTFSLLALAVGLAAVLPIAFSLYRAGFDIGQTLPLVMSRGAFITSDPAGPFVSLITVLRGDDGLQWGVSYLRAPVSWIPGFLWAGKPLSLAEQFAREYITNWTPGKGLGYSLLGESYANFGIIGPLLQYSLIGYLWGSVWNIVKAINIFDPDMFLSVYGIVGFYVLITMHRGDSSLMVVQTVQALLPILVSVLVVHRIKIKRK